MLNLTIEMTKVTHKSRPCDTCGGDAGIMLLASRIPPRWVRGELLYKIWSVWIWNVRGLRLATAVCHKDCLPKGFRFWTAEVTQDLVVYHSPDVAQELVNILASEMK